MQATSPATAAMPARAAFVIIGAGIHGLSTAWHLAMARGRGDDILVVDKTGIGAGASGIACGVVRNNYFQSPMRELMAHSVAVWESDPAAFAYHGVGYLQISPASMRAGIEKIHGEQRAIGYESTLVGGGKESDAYMKSIFHDWQAAGVDSVLHEKRGGFANNIASVRGLAAKAEALGVKIISGATVTGFARESGSPAVQAVVTDKGTIECEQVIVAAGPWVRTFWDLLICPPPSKSSATTRRGARRCGVIGRCKKACWMCRSIICAPTTATRRRSRIWIATSRCSPTAQNRRQMGDLLQSRSLL